MTKKAHIASTPTVMGEKALALCGKEFKVTTLWDDIPKDFPIHRGCVDLAVQVMTDANATIERARLRAVLLSGSIDALNNRLDMPSVLDTINADADEWLEAREKKQEAKAEKKKAKQTCTCTWSNRSSRITDPGCPIHGESAPPAVSPPDAPKTIDS